MAPPLAFGPWLKDLQKNAKLLRKTNSGCKWCTAGDCITSFDTPTAEMALQKWHEEWHNMARDKQDVHLLWIFHSDPHVGSHHEDPKVSNDEVPAVLTREQQLEIRIPTSSSETESDNGNGGVPGVSTAAGSRDEPRIPTSEDSDGEPPCKKPRRQYNAGQPRRAACSIRFLGHKICKHAALHLMRVGDDRLERVRDGIIDGRHDRPHTHPVR